MFNRDINWENKTSSNDIFHCDYEKYDEYNIDANIKHFQNIKKIETSFDKPYHLVKKPHILENNTFYNMKRQLNKEQATIVKDILTKKKRGPNELIYLFLTGGTGTGKTFTAKVLFQSLVHIYNNIIEYGPLKIKGLITTYTGKVAFNAGGVTVHFAFFMPFNKS